MANLVNAGLYTELKISSWNCQGIKSNIEGVKQLCKKSDIILLQETWLEEFEMDILNEIDLQFKGFGFSSMDVAREVRRGRPYGGIAVLWNTEKVKRGNIIRLTKNKRIMSMELQVNDKKINIINVYAPTDGKGFESHMNMCEFWGELNSEVETMGNEWLIVGGDFNTDYSREGTFLEMMKDGIVENNLRYGDRVGTNDLKTFISKANGSQSWIDHFLVSEKMEVIIRNVKVLEDVVGSDHQPLILHLEMEAHERGRKDKSNNLNSFFGLYWKGLSAQMKQMYSWEITEVLNNSPTPEVFGCKKEYCENEVHRKDIKGLCN